MKPFKRNVIVVKGKGRGKSIGIPTFNFAIPHNVDLPQGIYAGWLYFGQNKYPVAIHFGPRPAFDEDDVSLEAHVIGEMPSTIESKKAALEFVSFIRKVRNFSSTKALLKQIQKDTQDTLRLLA